MRFWLTALTLSTFLAGGFASADTKKDTKKEPPIPTEVMGKSFGEWEKRIKDNDPTKSEEAINAIMMFGPKKAHEAIPEILNRLEPHHAAVKHKDIDFGVRLSGVKALNLILRDTDPILVNEKDVKRVAAFYKSTLRKDSQAIMKIQVLEGVPTLRALAPDLAEEVLAETKNGLTWQVRKEAFQVLPYVAFKKKGEPINGKVIPYLRAGMDHVSGEHSFAVRAAVYQSLGMLTQEKVPVELFTKGLNDPSLQVRLTVLQTISTSFEMIDSKKDADAKKVDKERKFVVGKLEQYIREENDGILKVWANGCLISVTKDLKSYLNPILDILRKTTDPAVKVQAINIVVLCKEKAKPFASAAVLSHITDENLNVFAIAANAVVAMRDYDAIPELKKIAEDKMAPEVRRATAAEAMLVLEQLAKMEKEKKTPDKK